MFYFYISVTVADSRRTKEYTVGICEMLVSKYVLVYNCPHLTFVKDSAFGQRGNADNSVWGTVPTRSSVHLSFINTTVFSQCPCVVERNQYEQVFRMTGSQRKDRPGRALIQVHQVGW